MASLTSFQDPLCNHLDRHIVESNDLGTLWTGFVTFFFLFFFDIFPKTYNKILAFHKCKSYIEQGQRLEYMSWRLWHQEKKQHRIDNNIKQMITSLLLSPAATCSVHDAYSHEVPQSPQKCYESTIHCHASNNNKQDDACNVVVDLPIIDDAKAVKKEKEQEAAIRDVDDVEDDDDVDDEDYDDDDYYLSDEEEDEDDIVDTDDMNYHFVRDFKKTQPRPATPRRSLLSDLFQRASPPPPSLLSNSSSSFTSHSTTTTIEEQQQQEKIPEQQQQQKHHQHQQQLQHQQQQQLQQMKWRESFHGW